MSHHSMSHLLSQCVTLHHAAACHITMCHIASRMHLHIGANRWVMLAHATWKQKITTTRSMQCPGIEPGMVHHSDFQQPLFPRRTTAHHGFISPVYALCLPPSLFVPAQYVGRATPSIVQPHPSLAIGPDILLTLSLFNNLQLTYNTHALSGQLWPLPFPLPHPAVSFCPNIL